MKDNVSIAILSCLLLTFCKEKNESSYKPIFTHVPNISGKVASSYGEHGEAYMYYDINLIETSQNYNSKNVKKNAKIYFAKNCKLCEVDNTINEYTFIIRERTQCTEKYLIQFYRYGDDNGCSDYQEIINYCYVRDEKDHSMWIANMKKEQWGQKFEYHDTIYCSYIKKNTTTPQIKWVR